MVVNVCMWSFWNQARYQIVWCNTQYVPLMQSLCAAACCAGFPQQVEAYIDRATKANNRHSHCLLISMLYGWCLTASKPGNNLGLGQSDALAIAKGLYLFQNTHSQVVELDRSGAAHWLLQVSLHVLESLYQPFARAWRTALSQQSAGGLQSLDPHDALMQQYEALECKHVSMLSARILRLSFAAISEACRVQAVHDVEGSRLLHSVYASMATDHSSSSLQKDTKTWTRVASAVLLSWWAMCSLAADKGMKTLYADAMLMQPALVAMALHRNLQLSGCRVLTALAAAATAKQLHVFLQKNASALLQIVWTNIQQDHHHKSDQAGISSDNLLLMFDKLMHVNRAASEKQPGN